MKRPSLSKQCDAMIEGKIAELMVLGERSKAEVSEIIGRSPDGLQRLGTAGKLSNLTFLEVATLVDAAGGYIEFRKKASV